MGVTLITPFLRKTDNQSHDAASQDVRNPDGPFAGGQTESIEESAVGAAQIANVPTIGSGAYLSVAEAHRGIVQNNFQVGKSANADDCFGFPNFSFEVLPI